jgi:hypothetical protein
MVRSFHRWAVGVVVNATPNMALHSDAPKSGAPVSFHVRYRAEKSSVLLAG